MNVYDFDNTIYEGETLIDFILYYVKKDPKIWKYIPKLLIIACKDALNLFTVEEALKAYASFLEGYYVTLDNVEEDIVKFWDKNEHKIKPWYEKVRKEDDVVVSGTLDIILDEIMNRMNIKTYVGSSINSKTGKFNRLCFLENKVKAFYEICPNGKIEDFYTDSMNDKPLMDIAESVYFVKGSKIKKIK